MSYNAAHRTVSKQDLYKMGTVVRGLLRSIVGPPGEEDWTLPWSFTSGMNERNFLQLVMAGKHGVLYAGDTIGDLLTMFPLYQESDELFEPLIGSHNMLDELATLRTLRSECYNKCAGRNT